MAPNASRWARANDIFHRAIVLPERGRLRYIERECGDDAALRREIESLVHAHHDATLIAHGPALSAGTRLGGYEIVGFIAAGGMGEVYRARDTRLKREVAIKILPESLASDPDRLARFQREAEILATLNHPNIAAIYGLEEANGTQALVMEFVEGDTLADRIARGPIDLDEALPIAQQIAAALGAAHEHGVIHRDLKPANIKLTVKGTVKVLDFGLAKLIETTSSTGHAVDVTASPTVASPTMMTSAGMLIGTAAYMSPEQAKGQYADTGSDIWAFGSVLYEMLTARRAFEGDGMSEILASILARAPDFTLLPSATPPSIRRLLRRSLAKNPEDRLHDINDALIELHDATALVDPDAMTRAAGSQRRTRALNAAVAIASVVTVSVIAWVVMRPVLQPPRPVSRFVIPLSVNDQFSGFNRRVVALSPDGTHLVYVANNRLYLRALDQLDAVPVRGTDVTNAIGQAPFFSPDGEWIGFWQDDQLKKVSVHGGAPVVLCAVTKPTGVTWGVDDTIVFGRGPAGIWRVSGKGGVPELLFSVDEGQSAHAPELLPDGKSVLFTLADGNDWNDARIVVQSLDSGKRQVLMQGNDAQYLPNGVLVYARRGTLLAAPFDAVTHHVTGGSVSVVDGVWEFVTLGPSLTAVSQFSLSRAGTLVYVPSSVDATYRSLRELTWVDRQGHEETIPVPPREYDYPRISPDGTRVAVQVRGQENDIWTWEVGQRTLTRVTFSPGFDNYPIWTPDGGSLVFASDAGRGVRNLFRRATDGSRGVEQLSVSARGQVPYAVTPDGTAIVYRDDDTKSFDIGLASMTGARTSEALLHTKFNEVNADLSPDGRWIVYQSDESGRDEIYVRPFPRVDEGWWQVSPAGGTAPAWGRTGREIFYLEAGRRMMAVTIQLQPTFASRPPQFLFERPDDGPGGLGRYFDVSRDGKRFLMLRPKTATAGDGQRIVVVQNWTEELKRPVPVK